MQLRNLCGLPDRLDHEKRPLRHEEEVNLHDQNNRDIDHRDQELQSWNHHGLLNSKTMEIWLCPSKLA